MEYIRIKEKERRKKQAELEVNSSDADAAECLFSVCFAFCMNLIKAKCA